MATQTEINRLKKWARENKELANTVCLARAFAATEKERVDAYILPLFATFEFTKDRKGCKRDGELEPTGEKITDPEQVYLSTNEELCVEYFAASDAAHRAHGFDGPDGFCPASIADHDVGRAEHLLIVALGEFAGFDGHEVSKPELRTKALELGLSLCLSTNEILDAK